MVGDLSRLFFFPKSKNLGQILTTTTKPSVFLCVLFSKKDCKSNFLNSKTLLSKAKQKLSPKPAQDGQPEGLNCGCIREEGRVAWLNLRSTLCTRHVEYFLGLYSIFKETTAQLNPKQKAFYRQNYFSLKGFESNYSSQILKQSRGF